MSDRPVHELLAKMRAGDAEAAREFCVRMEPFLRRVSRRWLSSTVRRSVDSMDLTQSVFRRVMTGEAPPDFESEAQVFAWTAAVVRNRIRTLARRRKDVGGEVVDAMIEGEGAPTVSPDPATWAVHAEEVAEFQEAMKTLSGEEQQAIVLHDFQGLEFDLVARVMDRPSPDAARKLHARALRRLRGILARDHRAP